MTGRFVGFRAAQHQLGISSGLMRRQVMLPDVTAAPVQIQPADMRNLPVDHRKLLLMRNRLELRQPGAAGRRQLAAGFLRLWRGVSAESQEADRPGEHQT